MRTDGSWRRTARSSTGHQARLAAGGLAVAVTVFWLGHMVLNRADFSLWSLDLFTYQYFADQAVFAKWGRGELPVWNPYQLCGIPLLAALEPGAFYPPNVFHLVLPTWAAMAVAALVNLLIGALGTLLLARRFGLGTLGALVGAVLFTLRGTFPSYVVSPNMFGAAAWLPLGCLAVVMIAERETSRGIALLAAALGASFLAGHPQVTVYLLYTWTSLFVVWTISLRPGVRGSAERTVALLCGVGIGVAVASVQLLPSTELVHVGTRAMERLTPAQIEPFGGLGPALNQILIEPIGVTSQWSFGIIGFALVAAALLGRHRAHAFWALALAVLSGVFALGRLTPLFPVYAALPLLGWFRLPGRLTLLTDFGFSLLAATGFDAIVHGRREAGPLRPMTLLLGLLPAATLAAHLFYQSGAGAKPVAALSAVLFIAALRPGGAVPRLVACGLFVLVVLEVAVRRPLPIRFPFTAASVQRVGAYDPAWATVRDRVGHDRVWVLGGVYDPAVASKQATRQHLRAIDDYAPMNVRRQGEYLQFLTEGSPVNGRSDAPFSGSIGLLDPPAGVAPPETRRRLLDLASVRWVITDPAGGSRADVTRFLQGAGFRRTDLLPPPLTAYENPHVLPRAFTVYRTRPAPQTAALLALLASSDFDPLVESFVEGDSGFVPDIAAPPRGEAATFVQDDDSVVELAVDLPAPGLVVLADTFYPGWTATVDGVPAPIVATNHLFRGVAAPAGRHHIRFTFPPGRVVWGAAISAAGVLVIGALAARGRRARRA